jgi:monoamine oxidase
MSRSALFRTLRRALYQAHQANLKAAGLDSSGNGSGNGSGHESRRAFPRKNWSRRRFIKLAALAAGSTALATRDFTHPRMGWAQENGRMNGNGSAPRIAIVGAGIAGLNAAYQLKKAGLMATVYEASDRVGGRIQTVTGTVGPNLVNDLGGQLINSNHEDMLNLAEELGITLFNRLEDGAAQPFPTTAYFFDGRLRTEAELAEKLQPLAAQIGKDAAALEEDFDTVAAELDSLSVAQYLDRYASLIPEPWIRKLMEQTLRTEYGVEPADSTSLQLLFNLPVVEDGEVDVISGSDETFVAVGGAGRYTDSLAAALPDQVRKGMTLTSVRKRGNQFTLAFGRTTVEADYVILAIPFPVLRNIEVKANLPGKWKRFIDQVNLSQNEKVIAGFKNRAWRQENGFVQELWTDLSFAEAWDGTQQQGDLQEAALTLYFGGRAAAEVLRGSPQQQGQQLISAFNTIIPGAQAASNNTFLRTAWTRSPLAKGAYTTFKPGQLTEFADLFAIESEDPAEQQQARVGNLLFAGEQVSDAFYGYMNGSAETGRLAAAAIVSEVMGSSAADTTTPEPATVSP